MPLSLTVLSLLHERVRMLQWHLTLSLPLLPFIKPSQRRVRHTLKILLLLLL